MIEVLANKLKLLADECGVIGMKQSFEDEGVLLDDVITIRRLTDLCNLKSFVKIGGCEAKTDVYNCIRFGVNVIIAPMIESSFALSKFIGITHPHLDKISPYIVIESKTAYDNIDDILNEGRGKIHGVIVGRSDFSKSYLLNKSEVDSDFICEKVKIVLTKCKKYNLYTTVGGNISIKSANFIKDMFSLNILDRIETRNMVIGLTNDNINNIDSVIKQSLDFEIDWIKYKQENFLQKSNECAHRIEVMQSRS
jgi:hypothetical protein